MSYILDDKHFESWSELDKFLNHYYHTVKGEERVKQSLAMVEGDEVLDVGCWAGAITHLLGQRHQRVVGVDIHKDCIEVAKKKFHLPNIEFIRTNQELRPLSEEKFDSIIALELIEHLEQPLTFLRRLKSLLKPGGFLIVSTPNAVSYLVFLRSLLRGVPKYVQRIHSWPVFTTDQRSHLYLWDIFTLYRMLNLEGFSYVKHKFVDNYNLISKVFSGMPIVQGFLSTIIIKVKNRGD